MPYNITALQHSATIFQLVTNTNSMVNGLLMTLFVVAIFFIALMKLKTYEFSKALLAASAISFMVSLFFVYAKLINPIVALAFLLIMAFTALFGTMFD